MKFYLLQIFILCSAYSFGQFTQKDTITYAVNWPVGIVENNNWLFIAEADDNEISKIDLTVSNPTPITVIGGLERPNYLAFNGNYLYFTEFDGDLIARIDINQSSPIKDTVLMGVSSPRDLLLNGNDLYFTSQGNILKIDISSPNPVPLIIVTGYGSIVELALNGTDLYYSDFSANTISKIDISSPSPTPTTVISGLNNPLSGMTIKNSELYFSQYGNNEISKIDITVPSPIIVNVDVGVSIADLAFVGNDLYASDFENSLILKYSNTVLSTSSPFQAIFRVYPNPSSDFITIEGVENKLNCEIYNIIGGKVQDVTIFEKTTIDIRSFETGTYLFVFENGWSERIIVK